MIVLNILNFIGLSILKIIIVSLLFIAMGFSLVFMMVMELLTKALQTLNDNVN